MKRFQRCLPPRFPATSLAISRLISSLGVRQWRACVGALIHFLAFAVLPLAITGLISQVSAEVEPVPLLPKVVSLLYIQVHNKALQAPVISSHFCCCFSTEG